MQPGSARVGSTSAVSSFCTVSSVPGFAVAMAMMQIVSVILFSFEFLFEFSVLGL